MILSIFVAKDEWKIILSFPGEGAYKRYTLAFLLTNEKSILLCCFISRQQQQPYSIKGRCLCNVPKDFVKTFPFLYVYIKSLEKFIFLFIHSLFIIYVCKIAPFALWNAVGWIFLLGFSSFALSHSHSLILKKLMNYKETAVLK